MNNVARVLTLLAALVLVILPAVPVQALTRTWVSGTGDDLFNNCSRLSPCATFAHAITLTDAHGEINCLDSGDFGTVTINKSIGIICDEEIGHILVPNGTEGIILELSASDEVTLRGLDIEGAGTGVSGIALFGGGTLHVQEVAIRNFTEDGINFAPTVGTAKLHVSDETLISDCGGTDPRFAGIRVFPSNGGVAVVTINGVQLRNNSTGILEDASAGIANLHVRDTVAASSNNHGMLVTTGGPHAGATIDRSNFLFNGSDGLKVNGAAAIAIIGSSTISGNLNLGVEATGGGTLLSWKNNQIAGNVSDGTPIPAFAGPGGALQ